jgi:DNA mismatch repair protein MutS2
VPMDERTLQLLEFDRVRDEVAGLCVSPQGAALVAEQPVETDGQRVAERLSMASALRSAMAYAPGLPSFDFPGVEGALASLAKQGASLDGEELAALGRSILSSLKLRRYVLKALPAQQDGEPPGDGPAGRSASPVGRVADIARSIPDLSALSRSIFRTVDHDGQLREKDLPTLAAIRERIRRQREDTERAARAVMDEETSRSWWQTNLPAQRDGRLVLPLKAQYKGRVPGIVHELSASGSTVFIEPLSVVEMNNAVVQEEAQYRQEVHRILHSLSTEAAARLGDLAAMSASVAVLDSLLARARWAAAHDGVAAARAEGGFRLVQARHPLLGAAAVPISVAAGGTERVLIITGPNTGGKTVSLKTAGLLAALNQFGMEVPAAPGTELAVFDGIWADIGDEQSISQNLSTFSSHVQNLARFAEGAGPRSLVLLDELGAGTDPQEGVALAMALLDHFLSTGALVICTTHHGILKNYGATRAGAQNASMGFDRESLAPTFRILMGVPGESHALEIARRRGMSEPIIRDAEDYLSDERTDVSELVKQLSERHRKLAEQELEHRARETDLREKRRTTDLKELALRQKELELRRHGLRELREFVEGARREWEQLKNSAGVSGAEAARTFAGFADRMRERIEREEDRIVEERERLLPDEGFEVRPGMEVLIRGTGRRGRVVRKDRGRRWIVETETVRVSLGPGEMRPAPETDAGSRVTVSFAPSEAGGLPQIQLDVRGMRLDEALRALERQIDSALVHGLREFGVVHGKGEGILQKGIHDYLRDAPAVADFGFAVPEDGGSGKTRVTLKG